jgi:hypothetical protein
LRVLYDKPKQETPAAAARAPTTTEVKGSTAQQAGTVTKGNAQEVHEEKQDSEEEVEMDEAGMPLIKFHDWYLQKRKNIIAAKARKEKEERERAEKGSTTTAGG